MNILKRMFIAVSGLGMIYAGAGLASLLTGKDLCSSAGCAVIASYAKFGEISVMFAGAAFFILLTGLALFSRDEDKRDVAGQLTGAVLLAGCAVEGFLLGFQVFYAGAICRFCIGIGLFVAALSALHVLAHREKWAKMAGFVSVFFAVFIITGLVKPPASGMDLSEMVTERIGTGGDEQCYLFFGQNCSHCRDVIEYCRKNPNGNVNVALCPADRAKPLLSTLGVREVPALYVSKNDRKKEIIMGKNEIVAYLSTESAVIKRVGLSSYLTPSAEKESCNSETTCQ